MQGRVALVAGVAGLAVAAPAHADDADRLATSLRADPVQVDASVARRLPSAAAAQVRLSIAHRDAGRVRIAIVAPEIPRRAGGIDTLADAIEARLRKPGTLLVVSGRDWWLNTSYPPAPVTAAVQRAADSRQGLRDQLLAAVESIGKVDPGPAGDGAGGSVPGSAAGAGTGLSEGARSVLIVAAGALVAAFLAALVVFGLRSRPGSPASRR